MDNKIIVDVIQYVALPLAGALVKITYDKFKNKKYIKVALEIVEEIEEDINFNGSGAAGQKLNAGVTKLLDKHTFLNRKQATAIINEAVYLMNKALKK